MRCAEKLGGLQNHLVYMLITVVLGSRARIRVKIENVHNMRFCVLEWVYTSRMKNTQHQKDLFYERLYSIMEQDRERINEVATLVGLGGFRKKFGALLSARKKKVGAEAPARTNAPSISSSDPRELQYVKGALGAMELAKTKLAKGELANEPMEKNKRSPRTRVRVGGGRLHDIPRFRDYLKKKLIDDPLRRRQMAISRNQDPTLYQKAIAGAADLRSSIGQGMSGNSKIGRAARAVYKTGQWSRKKWGEILPGERLRALRVSAQRKLSRGPKI